MIIKKYVGKTESEATEEARRELGQNIVVMNVRPTKKTGFFSLFQSQKIEVTVALEEESERPVKTYSQPKENRPQIVTPSKDSSQRDTIVSATQNATKVRESKDYREDNSAIEEKLDNLSNLLEKNFIKNEKDSSSDNAPSDTGVKAPEKDEISEETMSFIKLLYNTLIENEVDEIYVNQLTDEVEKISKPGLPFDFALANVYQKMVLKFGKSEPIVMDKPGPRAEIFIGPTGVGKTTTIAKLASELSVTQKKKVALLTVDTYRIAAAEQLRTYASILEIPFRVIYSVEEMKQAAEDFKDYDFIMVDTAGHSLHNEELKQGVESFIRTLEDIMECENFLVLSATTKYRDLIEIADAYSEMVAYRLIFTKMDETGAKGNLYNVRMHTGAPVAYITNGQNVPDDIAVFDAQRIVKNLLGGKS
ncbi:flagellar biosynthesis protein FlhF [Butyrivibrio hungatei DSM 14810]|uniref:Flagellar biosynthesis protein FlhF n=1 Tax=Butyrivibrio hungatei DSM 14810 TaxID=1121132 RepID=A0A1M7SXT9_9FIRM|nr:flagellar biosynthesis protein FlhF [Butyrivibrio hungatei]SHN63280.1 flagellar biosynthesis protein FlhF [Butyrivibrio hungatei DSM 14810]